MSWKDHALNFKTMHEGALTGHAVHSSVIILLHPQSAILYTESENFKHSKVDL